MEAWVCSYGQRRKCWCYLSHGHGRTVGKAQAEDVIASERQAITMLLRNRDEDARQQAEKRDEDARAQELKKPTNWRGKSTSLKA